MPYQEATTTVPSAATASTAACSAAPEELTSTATSAPLPACRLENALEQVLVRLEGRVRSTCERQFPSPLYGLHGQHPLGPARLRSCVTRRPTTPCPKTSAVSPRRSGVSWTTFSGGLQVGEEDTGGGVGAVGETHRHGRRHGENVLVRVVNEDQVSGERRSTAVPDSRTRPTVA